MRTAPAEDLRNTAVLMNTYRVLMMTYKSIRSNHAVAVLFAYKICDIYAFVVVMIKKLEYQFYLLNSCEILLNFYRLQSVI